MAAMHTVLQVLSTLFSILVPEALQLVRKKLRETVPTTNHSLVMGCFNLMDSMLRPYISQEGGHNGAHHMHVDVFSAQATLLYI